MKMRFTIGRRIGFGFATFILLTVIAFVLTVYILNGSKRRTETVVGEVAPSVAELKELNLLLQRSHTDVSKWYYVKSFNDIDFRDELKRIIHTEYPKKKAILSDYSKSWSEEEKKQLQVIFERIDALFKLDQTEIIDQLNTPEAYNDPSILLMARIPYDQSEGDIKVIYRNLNSLIELRQKFSESVTQEMFSSINFLKNFVQLLGITLVI